MRVVVAACKPPTNTANTGTNRAMKTLKQVEARRMAHLKALSQRVVTSLKQADLEAREQFVQDLRDVAAAAQDALLPTPTPDE